MDDGPLGERKVNLEIIYKDNEDLAAKYDALAADARKSSGLLYNKPLWLVRLKFNCCGGSPP